MLAELSKNIASYRKRLKMTQEELARKLNVSFQAVSKWETGQSMPDISLLSDIAVALESDINGLMGYSHTRKKVSYYEEEYVTDSYYWGLAPSHMCYEVMKICPPIRKLRVLDIGCGEGKDAVFFARNGYQYDIIFSSGVFHYIPANLRKQLILNYQEHTTPNGIHTLNVFVPKAFIEPAPEKEENATVWRSGELATHYSDWLLHEMSESIFDCDSSGIPHQHCMDTVIAQNKT